MKAHSILFKLTALVTLLCMSQLAHASLAATDATASALVQSIRNKYCATLTVDKLGSSTVATVGVPFTYTITVTNSSSLAALNVVLTDTLPAQLTFVAAGSSVSNGGSISAVGQTVTAQIGTLAPGASVIVTINVDPTDAGEIFNTAIVTSSNTTPVSDDAVTVILAA